MRKFRTFLGYVMLIGIAISMLYPFIEMVNLSFADENAIFNQTSKLFYGNLTLENYKNVFTQIPLSRYFLNSLIVASITTVGQVIFAALAGYAFARLKFKFKNALFLIILITMLVPPQVNIIPLFFLMREMHLINSYSALILPGLFGGFGIFLMRQYFWGSRKIWKNQLKSTAAIFLKHFSKSLFRLPCRRLQHLRFSHLSQHGTASCGL